MCESFQIRYVPACEDILLRNPTEFVEEPQQFTQLGVLTRRDESFMKQMERLADDLMRKSLQPVIGQPPIFPFGMMQSLGPPTQYEYAFIL